MKTAALYISMMALLWACANPVSPPGGPRDMQAPQLLEEESTPNMLTNFDRREIRLTFDEFVELREPFSTIIITPALENRPEIEARRRTVTLRFDEDEDLQSNTTYSIQFGNAIRDFTEGNVTDNFRYVFSTGPSIDSFSLTSRVVDAETGDAVAGAWVMLYTQIGDDSLIYRTRPFYFAKTDSSGVATIQNIRQDSFTVTALLDENANYLYDNPEEKVAFADAPVFVNGVGQQGPRLYLFSEQVDPFISGSARPYRSKLSLGIKGEMHLLSYELENEEQAVAFTTEDSLHFWWDPTIGDAGRAFIRSVGGYSDTVLLKTDQEAKSLPLLRVTDNNILRHGNRPSSLRFNLPLGDIAKDRIRIVDTAGSEYAVAEARIDTTDPVALLLWMQGGAPDSLLLDSGSVIDYLGRSIDRRKIPVRPFASTELASIHLRVNGMDSTRPYVVELFRESLLVNRSLSRGSAVLERHYDDLPVGQYRLRVVEDSNENGFYDGGNFFKRELPEPFVERSITGLRPNWEKEINILFNQEYQYR